MSPQGRAPPPGVRGGGATDPLPPTATRSRRRVPWGGCSSRSGTTGKNASWWPSSMPAGEATWWGGLRGGCLRAWTPPLPLSCVSIPPRKLRAVSKELPDPYVSLVLLPDRSRSTKRKTSVQKKTLNPDFNERWVGEMAGGGHDDDCLPGWCCPVWPSTAQSLQVRVGCVPRGSLAA